MNNFYGILKIEEISDVIFDYYNKNKLYFYITCIDTDSKKYNNRIILKCKETLIDKIYIKIQHRSKTSRVSFVKSEIEYFLVLIYNFKYRYLSYRCE